MSKKVKNLQNAIRMLRPGGLLLVTCATTGRPEQGARRATPHDAPLLAAIDDEWANYYRNLDENDIRAEIDVRGLFQFAEFSISEETHDLLVCLCHQAWGIRETPQSLDPSRIAPGQAAWAKFARSAQIDG